MILVGFFGNGWGMNLVFGWKSFVLKIWMCVGLFWKVMVFLFGLMMFGFVMRLYWRLLIR